MSDENSYRFSTELGEVVVTGQAERVREMEWAELYTILQELLQENDKCK